MNIPSPAQYIYLRADFEFDVVGVVTGRTVTAKICEQMAGDPADIGSLTETAAEVDNTSEIVFARADLLTDLAAYLGKRVYLHLDDGVAWHDVWPLVPTDVDPSLLPPIID